MNEFKLKAPYEPTGDQPQAIAELVKGFKEGNQCQTLLGVTGSGKTFTMANVIQQLQKPTLVIAHNKTLAAQLYGEFKEMFPDNAVEYFVSYYDYYQPEAYVPSTDTYIEKDSAINDEIDKLRHSATAALTERRDVIIIASVSCIYGLGSPIDYQNMTVSLRPGMMRERDEVIQRLVEIQYTRNDMDFHRGTFRVRGDVLEIFPASATDRAIRVEFFGDEVDRIQEIDVLTGTPLNNLEHMVVFPASHYVVSPDKMEKAITGIEKELKERVKYFKAEDKLIEAQRISERTHFDIEMLRETGFCSGIENYSMHLNGMKEGEMPHTLLDYFAVMPKSRGEGIGSRALALLRDHCGERRFLLEIEQCDIPCENKEQRLRRRRFYLRNGMQPSGMLVLQNGVRLEVLCCGGDTSFAQYHTLIREGYGQRVAAKTTLLSENSGSAR